MDIKLGLEIAIAITALIGFIYRLTQIESKIYQEINLIKNRQSIHLADYAARKEHQDYLIHGYKELIEHKFKRCMDEIKQLESDLKQVEEYLIEDKNE